MFPAREADDHDQPAPTLRVPILTPSATTELPVTPPPSESRRISRSMLAAATRNVEDPGDTFPSVGETFLGFQLVEELGQGAFARVFLAHQQALAGRPVALKVTLRPTREAERLARLQHTNIVPVYSVHEARPMQVICMPFLGRRTIADLLRAYHQEASSRAVPLRRISGTRAARTTTIPDQRSRSTSRSHPAPTTAPRTPVVRPIDGQSPPLIGDPLAVVKVLAQLAAGLQHAHDRGILHLDLKPANVLYPDIGEPMLLDFNLSFDTTAPDRELVGGTIPYMAIEQLLDLRSRGRGQVDARTDLYSLGVMAFEMLTGTVPFPASSRKLADIDALIAAREEGPPSIRELNPAVTPAVEAIVRKLLAPNPEDRYQTAEELRIDAERHLNNLPLLYATEPSVQERFQKWQRRNPGIMGRLLAASLLGLAIGLGSVVHLRAEANLRAAAVEQIRTTRAALDSLRLDLILPGDLVARSRGMTQAEAILAGYGQPDDPNWIKRPEVRPLTESERTALAADLAEIRYLLSLAQEQASPAALPCPTDHEPTARDLFLQASTEVVHGRFATAVSLLDRVIADQPNHAAAHFLLAYSRQHLGQDDRALERYDTAAALLPTDPRPAYYRGIIYASKNKLTQAEEEYTRAIHQDPNSTLAYRNRGFARLRLAEQSYGDDRKSKLQEAEADFTRALELGAPPIQIHLYRGQIRTALGDKAGAEADRTAAAQLEPKYESDFISRGMARLASNDYEGALTDFQNAEKHNPRSQLAMRNQVHVLSVYLNRLEEALTVANRLTKLYPDSANSRIARAVLLAHLGRRDEAHAEAKAALKLSTDPDISYRVGCVYACTSKTHPEDQAQAIAMIEQALKDGFRYIKALRTDPSLYPLRENERFQEVLKSAVTLFQ